MTFSPFFFFFVSHLSFSGFFSLSLTLSLTAHQIRLAIRNIPTLNPFATIPFAKPIHDDPICDDPHSRRSRRIVHRRRQIVRRTRRFCLLIITFARRHRICSPLSHLLAVVAFARRRRFCLLVITKACSSSLKLDCRRRSNPSNISAPSHIDSSASFRRFSSHCPSTSTHTDCSTSLRRFKPQRPFGFHFNR